MNENEVIEAEYNEIMPSKLMELAAEIRVLDKSLKKIIFEMGHCFFEAKKICPHGKWGEWCRNETGYKQTMVEGYIKIYKHFGGEQINMGGDFTTIEALEQLGYTKMLALTDIPEDEIAEFVEKNDVENKTVRELKEIIKKEKEASKVVQERNVELTGKYAKLSADANKIRAEAEMYQNQIADLESKLSQAEEEQSTAGDAMEEMLVAARQEERETMERDLEKLKDKHKKAAAQAEAAEETTKRYQEEISKLSESNRRLQAEQSKKEAELAELRETLDNLRAEAEQGIDEDKVRLNLQYEKTQEDFDNLLEMLNGFGGDAEKYRTAIVEGLQEMLDAQKNGGAE